MPFEEGTKIVLEFEAQNQAVVKEVAGDMKDLEATTAKANATVARHSEEQLKSKNALLQARDAIRQFHREMFVFAFTAVTVIGALKSMASNSEDMAQILDSMNDIWKKWIYNVGNATAYAINFWKAVAQGKGIGGSLQAANVQSGAGESRAFQIQRLGFESEIARLKGDDLTALHKRQEAENIKIVQEGSEARKAVLTKFLNEKHRLEEEDLKLTQLNLKRQEVIYQDFIKNVSTALQSGLSDSIFNFLQGQRQSAMDIAKNFTSGINRAISDAISQSFFRALFTGNFNFGSMLSGIQEKLTGINSKAVSQELAARRSELKQDQMNAILTAIRECVCQTAANTGAIASRVSGGSGGVVDASGKSSGGFMNTATSILSGVSTAYSAISAGSAAIGAGTAGSLSFAALLPLLHQGGIVPHFPTGGEVPIMAQPGEFVVRRSAAQNNKDILKEINSGSKMTGSGGNVFIIKTNDANSFSQLLGTPAGRQQIEISIMRAIMDNGAIRKIIKDYTK